MSKPVSRIVDLIGKSLVNLVQEDPDMFRKIVLSIATMGVSGLAYVVNKKMQVWDDAARRSAETVFKLGEIAEREARFLQAIGEIRFNEIMDKRLQSENSKRDQALDLERNPKMLRSVEGLVSEQFQAVLQGLMEAYTDCSKKYSYPVCAESEMCSEEFKNCIDEKIMSALKRFKK